MNETQQLVNAITEGIQDKKGKNIVVADLTNIGDTICQYFIICQGNSPSQVQAIAESIGESARLKAHAKPVAVDGLRNAEWQWITRTSSYMFSCRKHATFTTSNTYGQTHN